MKKLSEYFEWNEFGISYATCNYIKSNVWLLCNALLDIIREAYGKPIYINSGYRTPEHNKRVGGVSNSQHLTGEACDFTGKDFKRLWRIINELDDKGIISYDQMIIYRKRRFIHISYKSSDENRNQKIIKLQKGGVKDGQFPDYRNRNGCDGIGKLSIGQAYKKS